MNWKENPHLLREQFEKETGKSALFETEIGKLFDPNYTLWLEQRNREHMGVLVDAKKDLEDWQTSRGPSLQTQEIIDKAEFALKKDGVAL